MSIETLNLRKNVWWMCMMVWVSLFSSCSVEDDLTPSGDEYLSLTFTKHFLVLICRKRVPEVSVKEIVLAFM